MGSSQQVRLCHANAGVKVEINLEIWCETKTKHPTTRNMSRGDGHNAETPPIITELAL